MNILSQLSEMQSVPKANIMLSFFHWNANDDDAWGCTFELDTKELKLKITHSAPTPEAAVALCHQAWSALYRHGVPAARPSLLAAPVPAPEPRLAPLDDEMPF